MPDRYGEEPAQPDELWSAEQNRLSAIRACVLCDETGVRDGRTCDHRARRGDARRAAMAEIRRVLAERRARSRDTKDRALGAPRPAESPAEDGVA